MSDSEYEIVSADEREKVDNPKKKTPKKPSSLSSSSAGKRKTSSTNLARSDSEDELISADEREKVDKPKKKTSKKSSSLSSSSAGKRKTSSISLASARKKTAPAALDVFGLSKDQPQPSASASTKRNRTLESCFVNRVATGNQRRVTELSGEYYIDLKVYNTTDAEGSKPEERWKKALVRVKFLTSDDCPQWQNVQKLVRSAHELFEDTPPSFYNNFDN